MAAHTPSRSRLERQISGALRDTINKHGPIDEKLIGSAAKRVYGVLYGGNDAPEPTVPINGSRLALSFIQLPDTREVVRVGDTVDVAPSAARKRDGWVGVVQQLFQDASGTNAEVTHPKGSTRYIPTSRISGRKRVNG